MVFSENDMVKCVKKGGLFSFSVSEIVRFNFFFFFSIHLKFSQETNKDYLYNRFVILLI